MEQREQLTTFDSSLYLENKVLGAGCTIKFKGKQLPNPAQMLTRKKYHPITTKIPRRIGIDIAVLNIQTVYNISRDDVTHPQS